MLCIKPKSAYYHKLFVLFWVFFIAGYGFAATNYCDVDDMELQVRAPGGGGTRTVSGFTFDSQTPSCTAANPRIETWLKDEGYNWCPTEGDYRARAKAHMQDDSGNYYWDSWSSWNNVYTVNFDSAEEWCDCGAYDWFDLVSAGNTGNCCGDDSANDYFESQGNSNSCCINGNKTPHDSIEGSDFLCLDGEIYVCSVTTAENFDTEMSDWKEAGGGAYCCTPNGWQRGPCPLLSITQLTAEYKEAEDPADERTEISLECYRGSYEDTSETANLDIVKKDEPGTILYFNSLTCGSTREFDTTNEITEDAIYRVHAELVVPADECDNCEAYTYFAKGADVDIPSSEIPVAFTVIIALSIVFLIKRKKAKKE